jgi:hypothetical protein
MGQQRENKEKGKESNNTGGKGADVRYDSKDCKKSNNMQSDLMASPVCSTRHMLAYPAIARYP